MHRLMKSLTLSTTPLRSASPALTSTAALMLIALAVSLAGLWLDPRVVAGTPAWLKPAKFAASTAIYALTLAWVFTYLPAWPTMRRRVGLTTAIVLVLEVAIIDIQAWRGTMSHFNVSTPLDLALWATMGLGIALQTLTSVAAAVAVWRETFTDRALGWAVRIGLSLTIIGASSGGLMTSPTRTQLADARVTHRMNVAGAHTVGAPDGGPGLPAVGWSRRHGDLRVPHFVGLHAVQVLPLIAFLLGTRRWPEAARVRLVLTAGASYTALFGILLWQALRGQALVNPDVVTISALAVWAALTAAIAWLAAASGGSVRAHTVKCQARHGQTRFPVVG
jgi:hypothetical protein